MLQKAFPFDSRRGLHLNLDRRFFEDGSESEAIAEELGIAESSVYHHMKHHFQPLVQRSAAAEITLVVGEEINALRSNVELLNVKLTELLNDLENQELVGGSLEPMNEAEVLNWLNLKRSDEGTNIFAIICQDEFAGYVLITSIDRINGHAVFGINISRLFQGSLGA